MINIEPRHLDIILSILKKYDYTFYIFGSRITEKAWRFSDIDLFYTDTIPETVICRIKEDFEESNLPYTVDIVNFHTCNHIFKKLLRETIDYSIKVVVKPKAHHLFNQVFYIAFYL